MKLLFESPTNVETEDREPLPPDSEFQASPKIGNLQKRPLSWLSVCFWALATIVAFIGGVWTGVGLPWDADMFCTRRVTQATPPLLEDMSLLYGTINFNGTFMNENVYRQPASPEVDAAWDALGVNYRSIVIPKEQAAGAGLRHDHVQLSTRYGGGYPVNVEGLHHLHCLNLLRQALYYNFEYYHELKQGAFKNDDYIVKLHVSHCVDILRQQLMCTVDIGVFGQLWYNQSTPTPFTDFNTRHKCRNFDDVRKWAEARQLPERVPPDFLQPPKSREMVLPEVP